MSTFNRIFFKGLLTILPIAVTIYIIYSAVIILENALGALIKKFLPTYVPGIGFLATLILIFLFGLLLNNFIAGRVFNYFEDKWLKLPFIRAIYSPIKDLMNLFSRKEQELKSVVLVKLADSPYRALGIVTRSNFAELNLGPETEGRVAVFLPLSYGVGGMTLLIPKKDLVEVDIPIEKAMSLAITAWVKVDSVKEGL